MSHRRPYKVVSFCFQNRTTSAPGWRALAVERGRSACACFTSAEMDLLDLASGGVTVTASSPLRCGSRVSSQSWNGVNTRTEAHKSELQSLMRISYAVFCLKKKTETPSK